MNLNKTTVKNQVCGVDGCDKPVSARICFFLGFSANFCKECANALAAQNLGVEEGSSEVE